MGTRTGTIVLGTIVPIRRKICYSTEQVVGPIIIDVEEQPNRAGGFDSNGAKVSPLNQRELESFAL